MNEVVLSAELQLSKEIMEISVIQAYSSRMFSCICIKNVES